MSKLTKRLTAMMLSGMLIIGSASGSVFASELDVDSGRTAEVAVEEVTEKSADAAAEEESMDVMSEDTEETSADATVEEEAEVEYYTVTLDANGGYFANEWDDVLGETIETTEVLSKNIPIGEAVATFPVREQENAVVTFMGWSLERDGEMVSQEYFPVENCVLYAVWEIEEYIDTDDEESELSAEDVSEESTDSQAVEYVDTVDRDTEYVDESADQTEESEADTGTTQESEDAEAEEDKNENADQQDKEPDQELVNSTEEEPIQEDNTTVQDISDESSSAEGSSEDENHMGDQIITDSQENEINDDNFETVSTESVNEGSSNGISSYPFLEFNGHRYQVSDGCATFSDAESICEASGGHLATVTSAEENSAICEYLKANGVDAAMIGLYAENGKTGPWDTWITGERADYHNWQNNQPDWEGQHICALCSTSSGYYGTVEPGQWDNGWDGDYRYLCEWDDVSGIHNIEELKNISNNLSGSYILMDDINLAGETWTPIGDTSNPFTGILDGNGHTINNLLIESSSDYQGLFGMTSGAVIKKLTVAGMINGSTYVGGIAGYCQNTTLLYCISNTIVSGTNQVGGLVGRLEKGLINYCMNTGTVTTANYGCGGIVSDIYPSGSVTNCLNLGNVFGGDDLTGGIAGGSTDGYVGFCVNAGKVSYRSGRTGAIVGDNASYAGVHENNHFLQSSGINEEYQSIGDGSGTFSSISDEKVVSLKRKILSENGMDPMLDENDISNCSPAIIGHTFEYTGSANEPIVMGVRHKGIDLEEGTDYTVEYQDNIEIGYGKVIIKGCGDYKGEKIETFEIIPGKVEWEKVNYDYLDGNLKDADFIWKTLDYIKGNDAGYQIRYCDDHYSLDSDHAVYREFTADNTNGKETIDNLQLNSTIKYQINAYKVVEGEKFEGKWSEEEKLNILKSKLSFPGDFWSFDNNWNERFDETYYEIWFGDSTFSKQLLKKYDDGSGGICYGMCNSVLSIFERNNPAVSTFSRTRVNDIEKDDVSSSLGITARDLIRYAHTYQFIPTIWNEGVTSFNDYDELMEAILSSISGEGHGIVLGITLSTREVGHALIPVNVLEDTNEKTVMSVYDCNSPDSLQKLTIYKKESGSDYYYYQGNYANSTLIADKYLRRSYPQTSFIDHLQQGLNNNSDEPLFPAFKEEGLIFVSDTSNGITLNSENNVSEIIPTNANTEESLGRLYWIDGAGSDVTFNNVASGVKVALMSYHNRLEVTAGSDATITLNVSEEDGGKAIVNQDDGASFEVRYIDMENATEDSLETVINGTGSSCVEISFDDEGHINFSGVDEISVSKNQGEIGEEMHINDTSPVVKEFKNLDREETFIIETDDRKEDIVLPCANGHTWNTEYTIDLEPTDEKPGVKSIHCQVCNAIKSGSEVEIPALEESGEIIDSGTCGTGITWVFYENGKLAVRGNGSMDDYKSGEKAPWANETVKDVVIYDGVTSVGNLAFYYCNTLKSISLPGSLSRIGEKSFSGCTGLTSVTIPDTVEEIGGYAFYGCEKLSNIRFPEKLTGISEYTCSHCTGLETAIIPNNVKWIGNGAFSYCSGLENVVIPEGVENIGKYVFDDCTGLTEIILSNDLKSIGAAAFRGCRKLLKIDLPEGITTIDEYLFCNCRALENVSIPEKATRIETSAFFGCYGLKKLVIPATVTYIEATAFHYRKTGSTEYFPLEEIVLCGEKGSYAEQYANDHGISFEEIVLKKAIDSISVEIPDQTYSGVAITPSIIVKLDGLILTEGTDYSYSCTNNKNVGSAIVTITGIGNYEGTVTKTFTIKKAAQSITASNLTLTFPNSGKITASGNKGTLSYKSSNTAVVTVDSTGKVTAKGAGTAKITITAAATSNYNAATKTVTVTVAKAAQSITAKSSASIISVGKTATVSITGAKGTKSFKSSDTTIAIVTSAGKVTARKVGTVKITATSAATTNYKAASKTVTIKVVPAATTSLTASNLGTGMKLTWKKVAGATGYKVYRGSTLIKTITSGSTVTFADAKANTNGTKYTFKVVATASTGISTLSKSVAYYRIARPAISSATNSAAGRVTVNWGKNATATGYQIQYSLSNTFASGNKTLTLRGAATVSRVIASLTKGKTYYIRMRTYKTVGSTNYWSLWSPVKSVKISK